jgi:hypothetical protein
MAAVRADVGLPSHAVHAAGLGAFEGEVAAGCDVKGLARHDLGVVAGGAPAVAPGPAAAGGQGGGYRAGRAGAAEVEGEAYGA